MNYDAQIWLKFCDHLQLAENLPRRIFQHVALTLSAASVTVCLPQLMQVAGLLHTRRSSN